MRILILHQNRYYKVKYDVAIDHDEHEVHYAGTADYLAQIPAGLRCRTCLIDPAAPYEPQLDAWLREHGPFDRILTRQEKHLLTAAELRERHGIPGMRPAQTRLFRDKVPMKEAILRAGLRAPRYVELDGAPPEALPWAGATILKPRDGAGSQGVQLFPSAAAALAHLRGEGAAALAHHELEEYLEGPIWHVDGYLFEGEPVAVQTSKYVGTCLDYNAGRPLGSIQFDNPGLAAWALECLRALGARSLTFHLEAIVTPHGPAFLEVAGRAGGGDVVETFQRATGIHLHVLDMASDVDGAVAARHARRLPSDLRYGFFIIPGHSLGGAPCRVLGADDLLRSPLVQDHRKLPEDAPTPKAPTYQAHDVPLSGIVAHAQPALLEAWMLELFDSVHVLPAPQREPALQA